MDGIYDCGRSRTVTLICRETLLFYGTEGSRLDEQIKAEQAANGEEQTGIYDLAIKHFSGPRQKAVWGVPGALILAGVKACDAIL